MPVPSKGTRVFSPPWGQVDSRVTRGPSRLGVGPLCLPSTEAAGQQGTGPSHSMALSGCKQCPQVAASGVELGTR